MTTIEFTAKNGEALIPVRHKTSFASEDEAKRAYETVRTAINEAAP